MLTDRYCKAHFSCRRPVAFPRDLSGESSLTESETASYVLRGAAHRLVLARCGRRGCETVSLARPLATWKQLLAMLETLVADLDLWAGRAEPAGGALSLVLRTANNVPLGSPDFMSLPALKWVT